MKRPDEADYTQAVTVSIVSHGHGDLVKDIVKKFLDCNSVGKIIITLNVPETIDLPKNNTVTIIANKKPAGFSKNHNGAFSLCKTPFYCVVNPDIDIADDPFPNIISAAVQSRAGIAAPVIKNYLGSIEDNARHFPTLGSLIRKALMGHSGKYILSARRPEQVVDWVAGMFMLFDRNTYALLGGFNEKYFLYYEDVDICARAWMAGQRVILVHTNNVVHNAQRASHRNLKHAGWHLRSMLRYLRSYRLGWQLTSMGAARNTCVVPAGQSDVVDTKKGFESGSRL